MLNLIQYLTLFYLNYKECEGFQAHFNIVYRLCFILTIRNVKVFHIGMVLGKDWGFILTIRNVKTSEKLQEMLDVISFILTIRNVKPIKTLVYIASLLGFILTIRNVKLFEGKKANRNKFVLS